MKELVVISGKGGTGKTSLVASLATLAGSSVLADCDVDAADLHLVTQPAVKQREDFFGGKLAIIDPDLCTGCGICSDNCRYDAIQEADIDSDDGNLSFKVDKIACEGCGVCEYVCPEDAVTLLDRRAGEWFISETRFGPMVHAKLGIAAENSGKLVSTVKNNAKLIAVERDIQLVIVDGSPGTGCPVISSITGADLVLVVTEPTLSGQHDLQRVIELAKHFNIPATVVVNKWDINTSVFESISDWCSDRDIEIAGKIRYDKTVTRAQIAGKSVVEFSNGNLAGELENIWERIQEKLELKNL